MLALNNSLFWSTITQERCIFVFSWLSKGVNKWKNAICFQNLNRTKIMDSILSGWYLRRKNPIVSIKYIRHRMRHTLRVKCSTKIVYSFEDFNFIERILKIYVYCVYIFMCAGMFNYFYIHDLLHSCMCNDNK
jgi:hypothetical protein